MTAEELAEIIRQQRLRDIDQLFHNLMENKREQA